MGNTIGEIARVTFRAAGGNLPGSGIPNVDDSQELKEAAELLHEAVREKAAAIGVTASHEGIDGWRWQGVVAKVQSTLWPDLADASDVTTHAKTEINKYLRRTRNMICLTTNPAVRGVRKADPVWWVRKEWNDAAPDPVAALTPAQQQILSARAEARSRAEARVTPKEAGEDRPVQPVETSFKCPECGAGPFGDGAAMVAHRLNAHRSTESYLREVMGGQNEPATLQELFTALRRIGYPGVSSSTVYGALQTMIKTGRVARSATHIASGHAAYAYTLTGKPARVTRPASAYQCREPGCGESFAKADQRARHEDGEHPGSTARRFPCPECGERYYGAGGVMIHITKNHGIRRGDPKYSTLMTQLTELNGGVQPRIGRQHETATAAPAPAPMPAPYRPARPEARIAPATAASSTFSDLLTAKIGELLEGYAADQNTELTRLRKENERLRRRLAAAAALIASEDSDD